MTLSPKTVLHTTVAADLVIIVDGSSADRVVLSLLGDLDLAGAFEFSEAIAPILEDLPLWLVFDLAGITFIDSSGLQALLDFKQRAAAMGAMVTVRRIPAFVRRVLDVTGMSAKFLIEDG